MTNFKKNVTLIDASSIFNANFRDKQNGTVSAHQLKPSDPSGPSASAEPKTILSVGEFFHDVGDLPYEPLPEQLLEQILCYHIIDKNQKLYFCNLHPECKNVICSL
jgi:hypothetical protein